MWYTLLASVLFFLGIWYYEGFSVAKPYFAATLVIIAVIMAFHRLREEIWSTTTNLSTDVFVARTQVLDKIRES